MPESPPFQKRRRGSTTNQTNHTKRKRRNFKILTMAHGPLKTVFPQISLARDSCPTYNPPRSADIIRFRRRCQNFCEGSDRFNGECLTPLGLTLFACDSTVAIPMSRRILRDRDPLTRGTRSLLLVSLRLISCLQSQKSGILRGLKSVSTCLVEKAPT